MYKKNFIQATIVSVATAVCIVFTSSLAMAVEVGECGRDDDGFVTCWQFKKYRLEVIEVGVLEAGLEKWTYEITRNNQEKMKSSQRKTIDALFALSADVIVNESTDASVISEPCDGDSVNNIGVGDCLRQIVKWSKDKYGFTLNLYVEPRGFKDTLPVYVVDSNMKYNVGTIIGPAGGVATLGTTDIIDKTSDGRALAVKTDLAGNILSVKSCDADCDNYPTNFYDLTADDTFDLDQAYFCIPGTDSFPPNSTLTVEEQVLDDYHCGWVEFKDENSRIQFSNRGSCRVVRGKLRCF